MQCTNEDIGRDFLDVQGALLRRLGSHQISEPTEDACHVCGSRDDQAEARQVEIPPDVLCLFLGCWENYQVSTNVRSVRRVEQDMRANSVISLRDDTYALTGLLMHQGDSPIAGHWVAIAKHGSDFFVYNDSACTTVDAATLHCSMKLSAHGSRFYAASLMYERVERGRGAPSNEVSDNDRSAITNDTDSVLRRMYGSTSWSTFVTAAVRRSRDVENSAKGAGSSSSGLGRGCDLDTDDILAEYERARQTELEKQSAEEADLQQIMEEYEMARQEVAEALLQRDAVDEILEAHGRACQAELEQQWAGKMEGDPSDNLWEESFGQNMPSDPFDSLLRGPEGDCHRDNAVPPEKRESRESVNNSLFRVVAQVDTRRTYGFEELLRAAAALAENCLRRHVTLPGNPQDPNEPITLHDGVLLPSCSCAFRGCLWEYTSVYKRESQDDHLYIEHPWDRKLRQHILSYHESELKEVLEQRSEVVTDQEVFLDYLFASSLFKNI